MKKGVYIVNTGQGSTPERDDVSVAINKICYMLKYDQ